MYYWVLILIWHGLEVGSTMLWRFSVDQVSNSKKYKKKSLLRYFLDNFLAIFFVDLGLGIVLLLPELAETLSELLGFFLLGHLFILRFG